MAPNPHDGTAPSRVAREPPPFFSVSAPPIFREEKKGSSGFSVLGGLGPKRHRSTPKPEESEKRRFRGEDATTCPPPVQHPNHVASTCDVLRRRLMGRTLWQTAHRRIPTEPIRLRASPSCFRPPPLVPGLFWFRARVILLPDGPTCPIQRLPGRGKVSPFPHPEPPLLFSSCLFCPAVAAGQVRKNRMSPNSRPGRMGRRTRGNRAKQSQTWAEWDI